MDFPNAPSPRDAPLPTSNLQTPIIAAWVVMTGLAAITVGMRFYTRRLILHIIGVEDWLILASMVRSRLGFAGSKPPTPR